MPFEGVARSHSAEFIAAQRARSRSTSSNAAAAESLPNPSSSAGQGGGRPLGERTLSPGTSAAETYAPNSASPPALFIVPSPVYAVMRKDDNPNWRAKNPASSSSSPKVSNLPMRTPSKGAAARGRAISTSAPIPEAGEEDHTGPAQQSPPSDDAADNGRASDETLADGDRDVERGDGGKKEKSSSKEGDQEKSKKKEEENNPFLVTLEGRPHLNPHTWNENYRWFLTGLAGLFVLNATFASSGPSQLIPSIVTYFGVSSLVGTLTIAVFVAGYCVGPLLWGPLSERYGRKWVFVVAFVPYTAFQLGCALAPNIGALLAFRFLGGCFAASPLTNSGGVSSSDPTFRRF